MNTSHKQIDEVLLDVRKAYRLLHDYQRMVLAAVNYIGAQLDIQARSGTARFAGSARDGYVKPGTSPWAVLPMVFYEFQFVKPVVEQPAEPAVEADWLSLSLLVISDTGFFEGDNANQDKEDTSAFALADKKSSSKFAFILRPGWPDQNALNFLDDKITMRDFITKGGSLPEDRVAAGFVGRCYDISCLASEDEANKIIEDVVRSANLRLERIKKPQ